MLIRVIAILVVLLPSFILGQGTSNMYHFTLTKVGQKYRLKAPQFLTAFNQNGYNNQPAYFNDKLIYFTTNYYDTEQTEIAAFDLFEKTLTRVTYTDEKEYSPTKIPGRDEFSVVRVEKGGEVQTLSYYPMDGIGIAKRYMNNSNNIGYHNWLDEENIALFLVEEPHHNLAIAHAKSERRKIILDKVGRCIKVNKAKNPVFVHKLNDQEWVIKEYNTLTNQSRIIVNTLPESEDFELLNDDTIIMGNGSKLYFYKEGNSEGWEEITDLRDQGISNIKRLASMKNSLVIVDASN